MPQFVATKDSNKRHLTAEDKTLLDELSIDELLHKDHLKVSDMFFQYEQLEENKEKQKLAQKIISELAVHSIAEEQTVYTAVRKEAGDDTEINNLLDESETEHHIVTVLMSELCAMQPDDEFYDAKICVLGELVRHHVREEEKYMFAKMKEANMDLEKLGQKFIVKKEELQTASMEEISEMLDQQLRASEAVGTKKEGSIINSLKFTFRYSIPGLVNTVALSNSGGSYVEDNNNYNFIGTIASTA